jgi:CubicO group peptidase (beta-lactamase class C family)
VIRNTLVALAVFCTLSAGTAVGPVRAFAQPNFEAVAAAAADLPRLHSLLVSHRGTLVFERYFNNRRATQLANVKSVSKSIISALIGIAIEHGHIPTVHEPIATYFGQHLRAEADAPKRRITIEALLTMRAGLESTSSRNYGAWVRSPNWVRFVLSRELQDTPGASMEYSTGNSHLLSAILTRATGKSTWQYAQEVLAKPLGFSLTRWPQDPQGIYFGGNEMLMTPRQMVAFGELYLYRGARGGRQIVPARWVDDSFVPRGRSDYGDQVYGYGWWMRELPASPATGSARTSSPTVPAFYAWGYGGQYIFVIPRLQLVVVTTSSTATGEERRSHRRTIFDLLHSVIWSAGAWDLGPGV